MKEQPVIVWGYANKSQYLGHMWESYRLTNETWQRFWDDQNGQCAGCQQPFAHPWIRAVSFGIKPEVDHCHSQEKENNPNYVRGLLCRRCNDFLGKIRDNKETLQRLADYLKRHGQALEAIQ
jgi:hypothetical protein